VNTDWINAKTLAGSESLAGELEKDALEDGSRHLQFLVLVSGF
jgi:hypothetical protein